MADVEMDLDPSRSMDHEDQVDEDLIEYDLDTDAMDGTNHDWLAEDLEIEDVIEDNAHAESEMDTTVHMEALPDGTQDGSAVVMDTFEALPFSGISANDADMLSDPGHDGALVGDVEVTQELHSHNASEDTAVQPTASDHDYPIQATTPATTQVDQPERVHAQDVEEVEIDFGTAPEVEATQNPSPGVNNVASDEVVENAGDKAGLSHQSVSADNPSTSVQIPVPAEEDELTWEEDDDDERRDLDPPIETSTDEQPVGEDVEVTEHASTQENVEAEEDQTASEHHIADAQFSSEGQDAGVAAEVLTEEIKETHNEQQENDEGRETSAETTKEDISYPSITVQYKGEEFPCFAAADGFFTNTSILEESIESLLAGFRAELAAELAPDEELVFHIDELGLEFAESTHHDILAGTTLQYVLDIYEMLVQNQDHDHDANSKNLYTYLFTRSSTSKRLEFLAESATSGKGLDEVIHLFEPAMTNRHGQESPTDTPGLLSEQGDDYPSPGDQVLEGGTLVHEEEDTADEPEETLSLEHISEDTDLPRATALVHETSEHLTMPTRANPNKVSPPLFHEETNDERDDIQYQEENEAPEIEQLEDSNNDVADPDGTVFPIDTTATATSASSTVDGNEIPTMRPLVAGVGELDNGIHPTLEVEGGDEGAGEEDLAEIDWRDGGEEEEAAAAEVAGNAAAPQVTPAKRLRAYEMGADDENDVKRQRSS